MHHNHVVWVLLHPSNGVITEIHHVAMETTWQHSTVPIITAAKYWYHYADLLNCSCQLSIILMHSIGKWYKNAQIGTIHTRHHASDDIMLQMMSCFRWYHRSSIIKQQRDCSTEKYAEHRMLCPSLCGSYMIWTLLSKSLCALCHIHPHKGHMDSFSTSIVIYSNLQ